MIPASVLDAALELASSGMSASDAVTNVRVRFGLDDAMCARVEGLVNRILGR